MFTKRDVVLSNEYLGFVLLSLFDLFLTGYLMGHGGMEANWLFGWILRNWHGVGFALCKFALVAFIIVVCEVIANYNLPRARMVILGGCALYVLLVVYECSLIFQRIDLPKVRPAQEQSSMALPTPCCPLTTKSRFHLS